MAREDKYSDRGESSFEPFKVNVTDKKTKKEIEKLEKIKESLRKEK